MNYFAMNRKETNGSAARTLNQVESEIRVIPGQTNAYELIITGFLTPGWSGRLAAGLAQNRVSIVRGEAEKVTVSTWHSRFELKTAPFANDALGIDYAALATTELPHDRGAGKLALIDFVMEQSSRHDGSLYLEIRGFDRLGFLGDLLDYFSMRCLFPVKMTVETVGDTALDRFWLRGVGGSAPSESIASAIRENLERLLISNA